MIELVLKCKMKNLSIFKNKKTEKSIKFSKFNI